MQAEQISMRTCETVSCNKQRMSVDIDQGWYECNQCGRIAPLPTKTALYWTWCENCHFAKLVTKQAYFGTKTVNCNKCHENFYITFVSICPDKSCRTENKVLLDVATGKANTNCIKCGRIFKGNLNPE